MSGKHGDDEITILEKEEILKEDETHSLVEAMKEEEIPIDQQDTIPVSEEKLNDNNLVIQHSMNYEHHHHHHHHHHDTDLNNEEGDKHQHRHNNNIKSLGNENVENRGNHHHHHHIHHHQIYENQPLEDNKCKPKNNQNHNKKIKLDKATLTATTFPENLYNDEQ